MIEFLVLAIIFQLKHFFDDYLFQTPYMLKKFLPGWEFFWPLCSHCACHAMSTLAIIIGWGMYGLWWLALVDFGIHFIMDRIKAGPKYLGRFKSLSPNEFKEHLRIISGNNRETDDSWEIINAEGIKKESMKTLKGNVYFWWSLGLDQMVHHLTHYYIIWRLLI